MGTGYQPSIPLRTDQIDGAYVLTKTYNENVRQNVRMIVLTEKGEKLTDINFGCGLKRFLFEPNGFPQEAEIDSAEEEIISQLGTYAPYVSVNEVRVSTQEHTLSITIDYTILPTNTKETDTIEVLA